MAPRTPVNTAPRKVTGRTRMAPKVVRQDEGEEITDDELLSLSASIAQIPNLERGEDGTFEMTEAELAVLEDKGATVRVSNREGRFEFEDDDPGFEEGKVLFKVGAGRNQFTGKLINRSEDQGFVKVWHAEDGHAQSLPRAHLIYYLSKGCWLPRPPKNIIPATLQFQCPSQWGRCNKMFLLESDAYNHFKGIHIDEFSSYTREQERARNMRFDEILDRLANGPASTTGDNSGMLLLLSALAEKLGLEVPGMPAAALGS